LAAPLLIASVANAEPQPARAADSYVDSIGVNAHFLYANYIDLFDTVIVPRMKELGIRHYRDGILLDDPPFNARLRAVGANGARGTFITRPVQFPALVDWAKSMSAYVDTLEGPNEPHNEKESSVYKGLEQPASLKPYQQDLYAAVRAEPMLAHVRVASPGIDWFGAYSSVGDLDAWADLGNFHHWPPSTGELQNGQNKGNAPTDGLYTGRNGSAGLLQQARTITSTKQLIATETGFSTTQVPADQDNGWDPGVSEAAAARYATRVTLELFNNDVKRCFLYELLDEWDSPHPVKRHQGLIRQDGSLKPHALALKNMIALLADPGADFQPGELDFQLSSSGSLVDDKDFKTAEIHQLLLQKSNGAFYLVLWNEAVSYDNLAEQDIVVAEQQVRITLGTPIERARTFLPVNGPAAVASFEQPTQLTLAIPDHPLIVELNPPGTLAPPDVGAGAGGTGFGGAAAGGSGSALGGAVTGSSGTAASTVTGSPPGASGGSAEASPPAAASLTGEQAPGGCACALPASSGRQSAAWALVSAMLIISRRARRWKTASFG